ncbi:TetR/AcrR family transcriptional regulator [Nocardioides sp. J2M5]|uniref:TetR/AcrR family transcriptional regulator n=1 Tax=Nocardioides palaemonis TaxID=2829810 RepID=UPI001BAAE274|nr:TetR/AcrR family transcriptional regulator [Nocardioides palaemonis]MBS2937117.1 TetR/AcrR family transcriptional regulator [Nocardioides palaemonis]
MDVRGQGSSATRTSLVDAAEALFVEHGYAATSLDAIVAGADVTKGALYHHFSGKQAIFEAALDRVEERAAVAVRQAAAAPGDPWTGAAAGLRAFLDVVREPGYRQLVVADGPAVLGHERFREREETSTYAVVDEIVRSVLDSDTWDLDDAMLATFARIFFGALSAAGGAVAASDDAASAADRAERAIEAVLTGLRELLEAGRGPREPGAAPATS